MVLKSIRLHAIIFRIGIVYQTHNDVIALFLELVEEPWKGSGGLFIVALGRHRLLPSATVDRQALRLDLVLEDSNSHAPRVFDHLSLLSAHRSEITFVPSRASRLGRIWMSQTLIERHAQPQRLCGTEVARPPPKQVDL